MKSRQLGSEAVSCDVPDCHGPNRTYHLSSYVAMTTLDTASQSKMELTNGVTGVKAGVDRTESFNRVFDSPSERTTEGPQAKAQMKSLDGQHDTVYEPRL